MGLPRYVIRLSPYTAVLFAWLAFRLVASRHNRPTRGPWAGRTAAIVPTYNEAPAVLAACVASVVTQVDEVWVVDDGSRVPAEWFEHVTNVRFHANRGKRAALAHVITRAQAEVLVTVDSDTIVAAGAVARLTSAFADERVTAATGVVRGTNRNANLLTRLIDLRYAATFLGERAAYSAFGSVLCCCGSLAAYRLDILRSHVDDLVTQRFLGAVVSGGDDRRCTNYALETGRAVLIEDARASTLVPERLGHFVRQQVRWSRSFLRETLWALVHLHGRPRALAAMEMAMQVGLTAGLVVTVIAAVAAGSAELAVLPVVGFYLLWTAAAAVARMSPAMRDHDVRSPLWLAPVYGLLHLTLLVGVRLFAFATVRDGRWLTRSTIEVGGSASDRH